MCKYYVQPTPRTVLDVAQQIIFEMVCRSMSRRDMRDAIREKLREVPDTYQNTKHTEVSTEVYDVVRSKVFNLHSITSILIAILKTLIKELKYVNIS